jgi:leucyl/phenylalanyl-tRNA---protein transferase
MVNNLPQIFLNAYQNGIFPMADAADAPDFYWVDPEWRGQLSIPHLKIPKRLLRRVRTYPYRVTINTAFDHIIHLCAENVPTRNGTWINAPIRDTFIELHAQGHAHSVEVWQGDHLVGGLYGLAIGRIFCGESMVSRATDASKIALVHFCARLWRGGFQVLDTQFTNDHLQQFGVYEILRADYHNLLREHAYQTADFTFTADEQLLCNDYLLCRAL